MNKMLSLLAMTASLCACGGSGGDEALSPGFAGTWNGTTTLSISGYQPYSYSSYMNVSVDGGVATVTAVCPTGSGLIRASGSGTTLDWSGSYACPAVSFGGCGAVTFTYWSATAHLSAGSLTLQGTGQASGCGLSAPMSFVFAGSR